jgi:hypothetical protein
LVGYRLPGVARRIAEGGPSERRERPFAVMSHGSSRLVFGCHFIVPDQRFAAAVGHLLRVGMGDHHLSGIPAEDSLGALGQACRPIGR